MKKLYTFSFLKRKLSKICVFLWILFCFFLASCNSCKPYTEEMKKELKVMYLNDQAAQKYDLSKVSRKEYSDSMSVAFKKLCGNNLQIVKQYFDQNGFPGIKDNGADTALHFWVIVQHGDDDVPFQMRVLKAMKKKLKKENVSRRNYAFFYDRVMKNKDKPQLYGTQMVWDSLGKHKPYRLRNPSKVNERRKKFGLESLQDYLNNF